MKRTLRHASFRAFAALLAAIFFLGLGTPLASRVRAQDHTDIAPANVAGAGAASPVVEAHREDVRPAVENQIAEAGHGGGNAPPISEPGPVVPLSLPTGPGKSAVTPQAISLPTAEGSIEGMGESFSPVLSSGTATYSVPLAVPPGRAGVQPSLGLGYSSSSGNSDVGIGWSMAVPFISRQTDRGLPRYLDRANWHPQEDRFFYNGGQELVPVDTATATSIDGGSVPVELTGWQQYRARVEGAFMRFFRSPDASRWVVQSKDGTRFDFGELRTDELASDYGDPRQPLLSENDDGSGRVFRWQLARSSDPHGSTVYYRYLRDGGQLYLRDIHYTSPADCGAAGDPAGTRNCAAPLSSYAHRVNLVYEARQDAELSYVSTWRVRTALRVHRVEMTSWTHETGTRTLVRRYWLSYDPTSFHSLLQHVQVEGRPERSDGTGDPTVSEDRLGDTLIGVTLPPMTFGYSQAPTTGPTLSGFGGFDVSIHTSPSSPPHSVDEARSDLFDVNSDGLPDLIVTDPARYRTEDGRPAVGVFFNGFHGAGASPSTAGDFSGAVPVPMPDGTSSVMTLSNLNIVPMDIDGDGRSDLLHMPRLRDYGYFTPVRRSAARAVVESVSPAQQTWEWAYVGAHLPDTDTDPRIDFGRDSSHLRAFDVNGDHLVDVVRTTGTEMQTWLNLGWIPGGDGRFGHATYTSAGWELSTLPIESCLLHDVLPVDFEDPEVKLADMNGDGLQDIVKVHRGRVVYWPGRGAGLWGDGTGATCDPTDPGAGRGIEMAAPPYIDFDADGVYLEDANGDGTSDVVQVRYHELSVWLNQAGASFSARASITSPELPYAPGYANRVRFTDIDGTGTGDIVWANAGAWQWLDFMGGKRPRVLDNVQNGLGAETTLTYGSSASEYLRDLAAAVACTGVDCHRWSGARIGCSESHDTTEACDDVDQKSGGYRSGGSPVVSSVVTAVSTTDHFDRLGREASVTTSRFAYHDGYYEGIEQEFRGFGVAEATAVGDGNEATSITRTHFQQGRRPNAIASSRLADNPDEATKGREWLTETYDETGNYLASSHASYVVRHLLTGLNGYVVSYAYVGSSDELRYNTVANVPSGTSLTLIGVKRELAEPGGTHSTAVSDTTYPDVYDVVPIRNANYAQIQSTIDVVDHVGNLLQSTAHGRIRGEYGEAVPDESIASFTTPVNLGGESAWLWRTQSSHISGPDGEGGTGTFTSPSGTPTFNAVGDVVLSTQPINLPATGGFEFGPGTDRSLAYAQTDQVATRSSQLDRWGQTLVSCADADISGGGPTTACARLSHVTYDTGFAQFPISESIATGVTGALTTSVIWDESGGHVLDATDPNEQHTRATYDGLGRVTSLTPPSIVTGCSGPTQTIDYHLTTDGVAQPISFTHAVTILCGGASTGTLESYSYVDGMGRGRASLSNGDSGSQWIQSGIAILSARGQPVRGFHPRFVASTTPAVAVSVPGDDVPSTSAHYDAFGRVFQSIAEDGTATTTDYQALTTDACDALDNDSGNALFYKTCTTSRVDGHGRTIDQTLRNRQPEHLADTEFVRLWSYYRADGALVWLVRAKTTEGFERPTDPHATAATLAHVERHFVYDSGGRRLASTDPDADSRDSARSAQNRTWRYLFNDLGDLSAVRDPRGCGQNFFYDRAGRLVGEDYVSCAEALTTNEDSDEFVGTGTDDFIVGLGQLTVPEEVDVRYFFDAYPGWPGTAPPSTAFASGRATASSDQGQRSTVQYDARGNAIWSARQIALIGQAAPIASTITDPMAPMFESDESLRTVRTFDTVHTYVRTSQFDHANRPLSMTLPTDPDFVGGTAPVVGGTLHYSPRGLPNAADVTINGAPQAIVSSTTFRADGLPDTVNYGGPGGVVSTVDYDARLRPIHARTTRTPTMGAPMGSLGAVSVVFDQTYTWDAASNLTAIADGRVGAEWTSGHRPQTADTIVHDALYHVVSVLYKYTDGTGALTTSDSSTDWRDDMALTRLNDPMRTHPAAAVSTRPSSRVVNLTWSYDWLGNMTEWTDEAHQFYERSLGDVRNGYGDGESRPAALYFAATLPATRPSFSSTAVRGGYVEVAYGESGNVTSMVVHGDCKDATAGNTCWAPGTPETAGPMPEPTSSDGGPGAASRAAVAHRGCSCATEQGYVYRWDEVSRLSEGRRYDRSGGGSGVYTLAVRQRHRYDGGNQRVVKQTLDAMPVAGDPGERVALYVEAGDYERRGMSQNVSAGRYEASTVLDTETQYLVGGARVVWKEISAPLPTFDADARITVGIGDLVGTDGATIDLRSNSVAEVSTYRPNGTRETYTASGDTAPEPQGFTGKESDEEVGLAYFGERYLIQRLGRWASTDPVGVYAAAGGDTLNDYHYVSGNLLAGRDVLGLSPLGALLEGARDAVAGRLEGLTLRGAVTGTPPAQAATHAWRAVEHLAQVGAGRPGGKNLSDVSNAGYEAMHSLSSALSAVPGVGTAIQQGIEAPIEMNAAVQTSVAKGNNDAMARSMGDQIGGLAFDVVTFVVAERVGRGAPAEAPAAPPPAPEAAVQAEVGGGSHGIDTAPPTDALAGPHGVQSPTLVNAPLTGAEVGGPQPEVGGTRQGGPPPGGAPGSRRGMPFTRAGRAEVWRRNAAENGGTNVCVECGDEVVRPEQHTSGVEPRADEGHVDHVEPQAHGGSGTPDNGQLLCRDCNLEKSDE